MDLTLLSCPVHREPLRLADDGRQLIGIARAETYPIIDGIPILLADRAERQRLAAASPEASQTRAADGDATTVNDASPLEFYNQPREEDSYHRRDLGSTREAIEAWRPQVKTDGPTLEIGSGRGVLQGVCGRSGPYVAIDYSLTALRRYIDPKYDRVCGTAEQLPFRDDAFAMIFSIAALEHVPRADLAFEEIARVLKPGGIAYLSPAWHCVQYNCDGIPVRPYRDLTLPQRWTKATLPLRRTKLAKAAATLPARLFRRAGWTITGRRPTRFRFHRLRPDYKTYWISDADACSRLDSHEGCLFFQSRGYDVLAPGPSTARQLLVGHIAVVIRKPLS